MRAVEYLTARGWTYHGGSGDGRPWVDPNHAGGSDEVENGLPHAGMDYADALAIQHARDAAEERKAWAQFAAGIVSGAENSEITDNVAHHIGVESDRMLAEYRARFAVTIEEES